MEFCGGLMALMIYFFERRAEGKWSCLKKVGKQKEIGYSYQSNKVPKK
jgi:hypothetical protein